MTQCIYIGVTHAKTWDYTKPKPKPLPTDEELEIKRVISKSCELLGIQELSVYGKVRTRELVEARFIITNLIFKVNQRKTLQGIGKVLGNKHHSTIIYYRDMFLNLYDTDKRFKRKADMVNRWVNEDKTI